MAQPSVAIFKIPQNFHNPRLKSPRGRRCIARLLASGSERAGSRGGREVITLDCGITVYPAREERGRWRAVWYEDEERQQCEAASEEKLAAKLEKVKTRLEADAPNMTKLGAALIAHFVDPDRLPVRERWSRKHAHTQLCALYAAPVLDAVVCQDIKTAHMQKVVNAAPTAGEGDRVKRMISALVTAGIDAGYLVNSRLAGVHQQAGDRRGRGYRAHAYREAAAKALAGSPGRTADIAPSLKSPGRQPGEAAKRPAER